MSKDGKIGSNDLSLPYLNPVNPEVQNWIRSLVIELASRYRDSPQFTGVAIRLMGWAFSSWQTFPSINWGYGDYTASRFEQDTGIRIPISATDPLRFRKRYDWLMSNHYNDWIEWRCATIYSFHKSISDELLRARQDLKLYVNMFGPHYSAPDWNNKGGTIARLTALQGDGWNRLAKEAGIDVEKYKNNDSIILSNSAHYPAGIRAKGDNAARVAELQRLETTDPFPIQASIKPHDSGTSSATRFYNAYMEHDFPVAKLGFKSLTFRKNESLRIAGAINPAGKHILHRYANALANGNLTRIIDGGLGYILNQPLHISEFLTEYHSLPNIGMQKLANNKSKLTLWMGKKSEELYFYLVNPTDQAAEVQLVFSTPPQLIQLSTGLPFAEGTSKTVLLSLTGYKLLALKNSVKESELIRVEDMNRD